MSSKKKYYKNLDLIRVIACLTIFLYHLNILKGGYLAVCVFFVLSGYLSCVSAFKKEKFSLLEYYSSRLLKIYLPLLIVVFITILAVSFFQNINWFNLKPETTSVIFGYNNFWQLGANLDYFARHVNSPFIHLWYIAILLQFDLIFPIVFLMLKKIGDKFNKLLPCIILSLLAISLSIYFYYSSMAQSIMVVYYNTFTRLFSLIFGLLLGFVHSYYKSYNLTTFKNKITNKIIFYFYLLVLIAFFVMIDAQSTYFSISMLLTSLIACRLIDYSIANNSEFMSLYDKFIKFMATITYEVYLIQYPLIFLFQYIKINEILQMTVMLVLLFSLSLGCHFVLDFKNNKHKYLRKILCLLLLFLSFWGGYKYLMAKDHTAEMKKLEAQLAKNQEASLKKQEEYQQKLKNEQQEWAETLLKLDDSKDELTKVVSDLSVVGIGDSVMLGAIQKLYDRFPNGYFDAKVSRTAWAAGDILLDLKNKNLLGDIVVLNLGANGDCSEACKINIIEICGDREIFWLNVTNDKDVNVNNQLLALETKYNNLYVIDWNSISNGHSEYFVADGIHLTSLGTNAYVNAIFDSIYNVYLKELESKRAQLLKEHDDQLKNKVSFYGNGLLLNAYDYIQKDFSEAKFEINKNFDYKTLATVLENASVNESLTHKIVFAFDWSTVLKSEDYISLIEKYEQHEIYIICVDDKLVDELNKIVKDKAVLIDFSKELNEHKEYLMPDGIHLTENGNKKLIQFLKEKIK